MNKSCIPIILFLLTSCSSGSEDRDLVEYVHQVLKRPGAVLEPLPQMHSQDAFIYQNQSLRSPFKPLALNLSPNLLPELNRPKEELEAYPLDALKLVGKLAKNNKQWVIIQAPDDTVHYLTVGGHLGQNFGKLIQILPDGIVINELLPNEDGGWEEHHTTMALTQNVDIN